jgi:hypothetical protein
MMAVEARKEIPMCKYRPGRPPSEIDEIRIMNFTQKIANSLAGTVMSPDSSACACDQCQADLLAYVVNRDPSGIPSLTAGGKATRRTMRTSSATKSARRIRRLKLCSGSNLTTESHLAQR